MMVSNIIFASLLSVININTDDSGSRFVEYTSDSYTYVFQYWPNGRLMLAGQFKDDVQTGAWSWWRDDGTLIMAGRFENNMEEGLWLWKYPGGQIKMLGTFHNGKPYGTWTGYSSDGEIAFRMFN